MASSSEEEKDDEEDSKLSDTRGDPPILPANISQVMNSYAREFIFILAVAFTTIAALQNGPLKTRKANPPKPFFQEPSLITDFYQGDFGRLKSRIIEKDISAVFFYAPWDAKSMSTRKEFESVAKFYHQEVFFAAINCWWPEGECCKKYKIYAYPVIMVFIHGAGGIRYEGPIVANYVIRFLDHVLSPIVTLWKSNELLDLLTKHEGVLIGYFDFEKSSQPRGYHEFYLLSLKALAKDSHRRLGFAVVTNLKAAKVFNLQSRFKLQTWNQSMSYMNLTWSPDDFLKWAYSNLNQVTQWVSPPGTKSRLLANIIEKSSTLIMFTPRTSLLDSVPYYDLLREVALEYENCNADPVVISLVHRIVLKRHIVQEDLTNLIEKCRLSSPTHENICETNPKSCDLMCCQLEKLKSSATGEDCFCRVCLHHTTESPSKMKLNECENTLNLILKSIKEKTLDSLEQCQDIEMSYPTKFGLYNRLSFKCQQEFEESLLKSEKKLDDGESMILDDRILTMVKKMDEMPCRKLKQALNYSELYFPEFPMKTNAEWRFNFSGLKCKTNRTLLFIVMDAVQFHAFAEKLGIDILNKYHQTAAIIVESEQESTYLLEDYINKRTLIEFIKSYTSGTLDRFLRSTVHHDNECHSDNESICIKELTTSTFLNFVLRNDTDVVLMYYAAWCGSCISISHIFLSVANYFSNIEKVKFARISGEDHDLPWEYTVEKYPTIIIFPAFRKADSVEFPSRLQVTTTNLFHFILANSQPSVRLLISMKLCGRECITYNLAQSSTEISRLFRDYKILLNRFYFVKQLESHTLKTKNKSFILYLIQKIRNKRFKIKQAYQLRLMLQKKREQYLKNRKNQNSRKYSSDLTEEKHSSVLTNAKFHIKNHDSVKDEL